MMKTLKTLNLPLQGNQGSMNERHEILHIKSMLSCNKKYRNLSKKIPGGFCKTFLTNPMYYLFYSLKNFFLSFKSLEALFKEDKKRHHACPFLFILLLLCQARETAELLVTSYVKSLLQSCVMFCF